MGILIFAWLWWEKLNRKSLFSIFFTGAEVAGSHIIAAIVSLGSPVFYPGDWSQTGAIEAIPAII